jgi:hypothetical protein
MAQLPLNGATLGFESILWGPASGVTDPIGCQRLRDEIDAHVTHLYGLASDDLAHILSTFPLAFSADADGEVRAEALLSQYDRLAEQTKTWERG